MRRIGILVAIAMVAHVWMLQAGGAPTVPAQALSGMHAEAAHVAATAPLPDPGHCPHGMVACLVQAPPETGDELVWAGLLAAAAIPAARRRRRDRGTRRPRAMSDPLPRPAVPSSVVLLE